MGAWTCPKCMTTWSEEGPCPRCDPDLIAARKPNEPWTCPKCGAKWPPDCVKCHNCLPDHIRDMPPSGSTPPPAAASASASFPVLYTGWGAPRSFGLLLSSSTQTYFSHFKLLTRIGMLAFLPCIPVLIYFIQAYSDYQSSLFLRRLHLDARVFGSEFATEANPETALTKAFCLLFVTTFLAGCFASAALYGSLADVGRGEPVSLRTAVAHGFNKLVPVLLVRIWMFLRLIPWFLLLVIPGIVKLFSWSMAVPACLSGDARSPEHALRLSAEAARGRRIYILGWFLLMGVFGYVYRRGAVDICASIFQISAILSFPIMVAAVLGGIALGFVDEIGYWLCYADAVAPRQPESAAAPFARHQTIIPFVPPSPRSSSDVVPGEETTRR